MSLAGRKLFFLHYVFFFLQKIFFFLHKLFSFEFRSASVAGRKGGSKNPFPFFHPGVPSVFLVRCCRKFPVAESVFLVGLTGELEQSLWQMTIAGGILFEIVLMRFLCGPEVAEREDFHAKRFVVPYGFGFADAAYDGQVVGRSVVDAGSVARALVFALPVKAGRVDGAEIKLDKETEGENVVVESDKHRLGIARGVGIHFLVGGAGCVAVGKARLGEGDSPDLSQIVLGTPETARCQIDFLVHGLKRRKEIVFSASQR